MTHQASTQFFERVRFGGKPVANPDSIVVSGHARFTVLTPRLIRLEWAASGQFEDRGTYAFPSRCGATPPFEAQAEGSALSIDTGALVLRYRQNSGPFTVDNLSITFDLGGTRQTWVPGAPNPQNLRGTRRTLDNCEGDAALEEGLLSRAGWSLFDDSHSVLFDPADGWVIPRPEGNLQDWYFFGYGHDYKGALAEYTRFGGPLPLIPRYVLGAWWSRYWAYSAQDLKDLVHDFERFDLPLDILVVDIDWHTPHSWTGYTWNRELFPDPPAFLTWVHQKGLRVTLNLHPAQGVQTFEEIYPRFAAAMGLDPEGGEPIPFRIADKRFAQHYFELLHHPLEDGGQGGSTGVDFWWLDWQQGESSEMLGLDPLLWLNHLHFADSTRRGLRPMLYSRWAGLGNHRYQTGFSGDTWVGWPALQFQPHFTATASNVAYGWWGHDIGGHMGGPTEPELFARWVQYGALSPSLRLHATKDPLAERRPWKYPEPVYQAAKAAFHWRYQLVPYLYTMARVAHDTGVSLCRPMYYEHPEEEAAYTTRFQYYFGDQMIAAPIVQPADPATGLAATDIWIPPGTWIDYQTKETFTGPNWVRLIGDLDRMPMLIRAGGILPLAAPFETPSPLHLASGTTAAIPREQLILSVFPGGEGSFRLYEDDGLTEAYQEGQCEWTAITTRMDNPGTWVVHIAPVEGHCPTLPDQRGYEIWLEGSRQPDRVLLNGLEISDWSYDAELLRTTIRVPVQAKTLPVIVTAVAYDGISALSQDHNRRLVQSDIERLLGEGAPDEPDHEALLEALLRRDVPGRADAIARLGGPLVCFLEFTTPEEASQQLGRVIIGAPAYPDDPITVQVSWALSRGTEIKTLTTSVGDSTQPLILDAPFAFEGQIRTMRWTAEVQLTWRGETLTYAHQSQVLFPTIHAWRALIYNQDERALGISQVLDAEARPDGTLGWQAYDQPGEALISTSQPHRLHLSRDYGAELEQGVPLAAYLTSTVVSPDEREAVLHFRSVGPVQIHVNGHGVEEVPVEQQAWLPAMLREGRSSAIIPLRTGSNSLLVHTQPPQEVRPGWSFSGAFTTVDGEPMIDLAYE